MLDRTHPPVRGGRLVVDAAGLTSGLGVLLVNDLADLVRVRSGPAGTAVRVLLRLPTRRTGLSADTGLRG
ncbi:hypothetical protein [Saccharothrix sp. HUAS TT1]|uniref:hypothetical protein n=1 Tax=unclassified Saccharothrix TaxID=2593673 RepID=UPI00345B7BF7